MKWFKRFQSYLEESVKTTNHDESVLEQPKYWMQSITWALIGTSTFAVGWLAIAQTEEIVVATGKLEPIGAVKDIQMPLGGIADKILVREGDRVSAGQALILLDTESTRKELESLEESIRLKKEQLELKEIELNRYLQMNSEEAKMLESNLALDKEILKRFQILAEEGASAELQYLQQRNKVGEVEGRLMQTKVDRFRQSAILKGQLKQLRTELTDLEARTTNTGVTLKYQTLRAPVDGVVFDLKPKSPGYAARDTQTVMKVVPFDQLEAKVEVPSSDIGFVRTGMKADLSIDSFPASDFGVIEGKVVRVGSDALAPSQAEQRNEYRFPTTIKLSSQKLQLKNGDKLPLQVGMSLTANIKLRKVSYLQLLLGSFKEKTSALQEI